MSEVKRYRAGDFVPVQAVSASDFDAAQSKLAAAVAREASIFQQLEICRRQRDLGIERQAALREELAIKAEAYQGAHMMCTDLKASLTAAEQRNAELEAAIMSALDDSAEDAQSGEIVIQTEDYEALVALLVKPIESGASE